MSFKNQEIDYDFIIVLCADKKGPDGKFPDFKNGAYLGGQVRMDAAVSLSKKYPEAVFVLVGGYDEKSEASEKVRNMKDFIQEKNPEIKKIREIPSLPCTKHNLVAVFNSLKKESKNTKIGLLTNFYHMPRAFRFYAELLNGEFSEISMAYPISAESIVYKSDSYIRFIEYLIRLDNEQIGLRDIEEGEYTDNCLEKNFENFSGVIKVEYKNLLTKKEQQKDKIIKLLKEK